MDKKSLLEKIDKMQKALENPNIQGETKRAIESSLKNAKAQLAKIEKPEKQKPALAKISKPKSAPPKKKAETKPAPAKPYLPKLRIRRIKKVDFEPSPKSKGLEGIIRNIVAKDALQASMNVVNFDQNGITATDAQVLLFIHSKVAEKGTYCLTKTCFENVPDASKVTFPNYESVIPSTPKDFGSIKVRTFLVAIDIALAAGHPPVNSTPIGKLTFGKKHCFVDLNKLKKVLPSLLMLGHEEINVAVYGPEKAVAFFDKEAAEIDTNSDFMLFMPFLYDEKAKNQPEFICEKMLLKTKKGNVTCEQIEAHYNVYNLTKKDYYTAMDKHHPELTLKGVQDLAQKEYDTLFSGLSKRAKQMGAGAQAEDYAQSYIHRHIPKGKKSASPAVQDKANQEKTETDYSWRKAVELAKLNRVFINVPHYHIHVEKEMTVRLKGNGNSSIDVLAKPGEHLIFDDKGFLVYVMNAASFKRKYSIKKEVPVQDPIKVKMAPPPLPGKAEKAPKQAVKDTVKKPAQSSVKPKTKKKTTCTLEDAETGRRLAKTVKFFIDEAQAWNSSKSSRKITKIMRSKGEKQAIILEMADYKGFATGLATLIGGKRKYYRLCIDSFKLTKVNQPRPGTYNLVVKEKEIKEVYTTKGAQQYQICLKTYRKLLKCSFEGTCTPDQSKQWKSLYHECGDLVQKLEKNPDVLRNFHSQVKKRRKSGETYAEAMHRVAVEIKLESH